MYQVQNPATGELLRSYDQATDEQVTAALDAVAGAASVWGNTPIAERAAVLSKTADQFRAKREELASIITVEMGKLRDEALFEVDLSADIFQYYADNAESLLADEEVAGRGAAAVITKRPLGALLGIMPWNYPYYQIARFAAPNLLLGNTILLKPAPGCPDSAHALQDALVAAGIPAGAYETVFASNDQIATVIADPRIHGISLTGSERAGEAVGSLAGAALKKHVLELGGSDAFIVLDAMDGDGPSLDEVIEQAVLGRMENTGQACDSPKRFIVAAEAYDRFVTGVTDYFAGLKAGDPAHPDTTLAPLSSKQAVTGLLAQIEDAVSKGATLRTGGKAIEGDGSYLEATVLTDVRPGMRAYSEELFGPVAVIYKVESDDEAVSLANSSPYGLGSAVFASDEARALAVANRLEVGMVGVNVPADTAPDLPFGGVKRSGVGRELGTLGVEEFVNKKLVRTPAN